MGLFDSFFFSPGILPGNKVPDGHEFQTKDLEPGLSRYYVDKDGFVKVFDLNDHELTGPINVGCEVYSYEFLYDDEPDIFKRKYLGSRYQAYKIIIVNSKLVYVEKLSERGYEK